MLLADLDEQAKMEQQQNPQQPSLAVVVLDKTRTRLAALIGTIGVVPIHANAPAGTGSQGIASS